MAIGILAYGSLIDDPGKEICAVLAEKRPGVETPFRVEFARASRTRCGGPTLVPVDDGGKSVKASVLVLKDRVSECEAKNMLYRREIGCVGSNRQYDPDPEKKNQVYIKRLENEFSCDVVLYTRIAANIKPLTACELAKRAIASVRGEVGEQEDDGISYLRRAMANGIHTPLTEPYRDEVLKQTGTSDLEKAWRKAFDQQKIRNQ